MSLRAWGRRLDHVLIAGFGVTGHAVAEFCEAHGIAFSITESRDLSESDLGWVRLHAIDYETSGHTLRLLDRVDALVLSPGVPLGSPIARAASERGLPILSELDLATTAGASAPVIAVTGTNGKSTTVSLIGEILSRMGLRAPVSGNIGTPFLSIVEQATSADAIVVEVSSFQLEQSSLFHPRIAVLLNLASNHLERHGSMEAYRDAKQRIFARQTPGDVAILPCDLASRIDFGRGRVVHYDRPVPHLPRGSERLTHVNRLNLAAAVSACLAFRPGSDITSIAVDQLTEALHLPFRQEYIGSIAGVRLINDSKATSPAATIAALQSISGPILLLLGGRSKKGGYDDLARSMRAAGVRNVIVYGEARHEISGYLAETGIAHRIAVDLDDAVDHALRVALPGDTLLLSPACSSFDQFGSFEERGEAFTRLCRRRSGFSPASFKDL